MWIEEEEDDPRKIDIPKAEGQCNVEGPKIKNPNVIDPLKTSQENIRSNVEPKFANIGDYWDDDTVDKVAELLHEYQDLFPTKFLDLKVIVGDLGTMKITLKPDAKSVKQRPYRVNPKYKEKVRK